MKWRDGDLLIAFICSYILDSCTSESSMILFRFQRASEHYKNYVAQDYDIDSDPLNSYSDSQDAMKELCGVVRKAIEFSDGNKRARTKQRTAKRLAKLRCKDDATSSASSVFEVQECVTRQRWGNKRVRCLRCPRLRTEDEEIFVASGRVNEFMYQLEPGTSRTENFVRLTGLIEPSAVVQNKSSFLYFHSQFRVSRNKMERICSAINADRIRLCGALFDALTEQNLPRMNNLKLQRCSRYEARGNKLQIAANFLTCRIMVDVGYSTRSQKDIFVLADSRDDGAAFVLKEETRISRKTNEMPTLKLHARVTNIGALLYPLDRSAMEPINAQRADLSKPKGNRKKKRKRGRKSKRSASPQTSEEYSDPEEADEPDSDTNTSTWGGAGEKSAASPPETTSE